MNSKLSRRGLFRGAAGLAAGTLLAGKADAVDVPQRTGGPVLRVGCCAYSYRDYLQGKRTPAMTLEGFLDRCAEMGLDGVELTSYYFPPDSVPQTIRKLVRRAFLLGLDINGTAVGNTFTLPPGPEREKQLALVKQWTDYATDMGGPCVRVFAGGSPQGTPEETARGWVVECLKECCDYAGARGVMLALENHGGVVARPDGVLKILEAVDSEWLGVKLDTGNFRTADPYGDAAKVAPYAISTHLKTEVYPNNQRQDVDMPRLVKLLRDVGYRGFMHLEYEAAEDPATAVPRTLAELRRLVSA